MTEPFFVRWLRVCVVIVAASLIVASPVGADAPGPTDYLSSVVAITPSTEVISVRFIGGDSFIEMTVEAGHEVIVLGYNGEPYLRFGQDGVVEVNKGSRTWYLNEDRFGRVEIPAGLDARAEPQWLMVAGDGVYAWHDHRTHWMNEVRPPAASPGDRILEAVVPLVVDDVDVDIEVESTWVAGPGALTALLLGFIAVVALVAMATVGVTRRTPIVAASALLALVLGMVAYFSVPPETGPSDLLWLLPVAAVVALVGGVLIRSRSTASDRTINALGALAGAELFLWGFVRADGLTRAIIPSDAPALLDRIGITSALALGSGFAVQAVVDLLRVSSTLDAERPEVG